MSGFFQSLLEQEIGGGSSQAKTAATAAKPKADTASSPQAGGGAGSATGRSDDRSVKTGGANSESKDKGDGDSRANAGTKEASADARLEKVAADTLATKKYVDKVASILREDHGEDDERLFRSCASTVVHLKLAGRIKPEFDNPRDLAEMAYHLYGDILDNQ